MRISPVEDSRALGIDLEDEKILVVGDLHLGITAELSERGIEIPSQVPKVQKKLLKLLDTQSVDRLILLGDVKHNVPITSWDEWERLPDFFSRLSREVKIEITPGNHDGDIEGLIPRNVVLHGADGTTIGDGRVGLVHGHAWPKPELFQAETLIMGHNHPMVEFRDKLGGRVTELAWVRTELKPENLPEKYRKTVKGSGPKVTIVPAFSELVGGGAINRKMPEKLLGPIFEADAIELEKAEIYLLDGTFLGNLENLREVTPESS